MPSAGVADRGFSLAIYILGDYYTLFYSLCNQDIHNKLSMVRMDGHLLLHALHLEQSALLRWLSDQLAYRRRAGQSAGSAGPKWTPAMMRQCTHRCGGAAGAGDDDDDDDDGVGRVWWMNICG